MTRTGRTSNVFVANAIAAAAQHVAGSASNEIRTRCPSSSSTVRPSTTSRTNRGTFSRASVISVGGRDDTRVTGGGAGLSDVHAHVRRTMRNNKDFRSTRDSRAVVESLTTVSWRRPD